MVRRDDRDAVELGLEEQMNAAIAHVASFHGVILAEDPLNAEVPVDRVALLLIAEPGRCRRARSRCGKAGGRFSRPDAAVRQKARSIAHGPVYRGCGLRRPGIGAHVVEHLVVSDAEAGAERRPGVVSGRVGKPNTRSKVLLLRSRRGKSQARREHPRYLF